MKRARALRSPSSNARWTSSPAQRRRIVRPEPAARARALSFAAIAAIVFTAGAALAVEPSERRIAVVPFLVRGGGVSLDAEDMQAAARGAIAQFGGIHPLSEAEEFAASREPLSRSLS